MSVTAAEVHDLIDQHTGSPPICPQEIDRIVHVLNKHGCSAGRAQPLGTFEVPDVPSIATPSK